MSRIEQEPNGIYVKKVDDLVKQIIDRLYKEIVDRRNENDRIKKTLQEVVDYLEAKKIIYSEMQIEIEDIKLAMQDYVLSGTFNQLLNRYNNHEGKGGAAHPLATDTEAGFMSPAQVASIKAIDDKFVKKAGDTLEGEYTFTENTNGFVWQSTTDPNDKAHIRYVSNDTDQSHTMDSTLYIEVEGQGDTATGLDRLVLGTVAEIGNQASEVRIRTIKKDGSTTGGAIVLETDTVSIPKDLYVGGKMSLSNFAIHGMDVHVLRLVSAGLDSARSGEAACYYNGQKILPTGAPKRGYSLIVIDRATGVIEKMASYDTHEDTATTSAVAELARLINDLKAINHTKILGLWTHDQASIEKASTKHADATVKEFQKQIFRFGGSKAVINMEYRSAYTLIGIADIGEGNGIEQMGYPNPVETGTLIVGGTPMAMNFRAGGSAAPDPETIQGVVNTGAIPDNTKDGIALKGAATVEIQRAIVQVWNTGFAAKLIEFEITQTNRKVDRVVVLPDASHCRFLYGQMAADNRSIELVSENACYAIGATGVSHNIAYGYRVTFIYA